MPRAEKRKLVDPAHLGARKARKLRDHDSASSSSSSASSSEADLKASIDSGESEDDTHTSPLVDEPLERIRVSARRPPLSKAPTTSRTVSTADFADLGMSPALIRALKTMSIRKPTLVQAACIPPLLNGQDCIGNAKTGSGKTVAFAIPILQKLATDPYGIFALVLTPTRELAFQISEQFNVLGSSMNIKTSVVVGGMDMMAQAIELRARPHVVVATPGRLVDLMSSGTGEWSLSRVKFLVLDEADRLLTSTFAEDLKTIFAAIPSERQTGLFTATITPTIENLASAVPRPGKQKPVVYRDISSVETVETLKQYFFLVPSHVREVYLYHLLCNPPESILHLRREPPVTGKATVKKSRKPPPSTSDDPDAPPPTTAPHVHLRSTSKNSRIRATALHSHLSQPARLQSLQLFRASVVPVLVCTDVASRGLDMEGVGLVINWDMPTGRSKSRPDEVASRVGAGERDKGNEDDVGGAEEYVHRVGRTARMGKGGVAISFITERPDDAAMVESIEQRIHTKLEEYTMPESAALEKLNLVSTAKRTASMELHDSDFGKRQEVNRTKKKKIHGGR